MELLFILGGIVLLAPVVIFMLRSMNLLTTEVGSYYSFTPIFQNVKPWTVGLYIAIIAGLSFVVLLLLNIPHSNLPA